VLRFSEGSDTEPYITPAGFQFLLLDTSSQIWYFMLQYLETTQNRGMDLVECLTFLFQLSFLTLGKDYSTDNMTENQKRFLQNLREFGLVYQRKRKEQRFYPTRLAINLTSSIMKEGPVETGSSGFIVVETNYRIYAYTGSSLQLALLALFCKMLYRFPNLAVCNITRDSVRSALVMGITADQIINYLHANAHPEMLKKKPVVPSTVTDQIRLWELERDRFRFAEGVLYSQFLCQRDFELLRDYARDQGVLVWENPLKRVLVVTRAGHDDVRRFWKRHKQDS
jgi:transcription initiation factor TFIIH subunit 4